MRKILFVTQFAMHFYYFQSILKAFLAHGYEVRLLVTPSQRLNKPEHLRAIENFKKKNLNFDFSWAALNKNPGLVRKLLYLSRDFLNYRRYLLVEGQSDYYRERMIKLFPRGFRFLLQQSWFSALLKTGLTGFLFSLTERLLGPEAEILADLKKFKPEALFATPVNMRRGFWQRDLEYLKAAKFLGIPTFVPVISWDNLTTKGNFHVKPDLLLAWNEAQVKEAFLHHGISREKTRLIGAPLFDPWFEISKPKRGREEFASEFGLDPSRPILTYLGSSINIAKDESWLVLKLREELDKSSEAGVRDIQLILRPHPAHSAIYNKISRPGITLVPKEGQLGEAQFFYDTIYHSFAAVAGVNTSAAIDALLAGKPVASIITPEYRKTQLETVHFRQLLESGALDEAEGPEDFPRVAKKLLAGEDSRKKEREEFIKKFVRPRGLKYPAGELAVQAVRDFICS